jgi:cytochrome c peroxidase
MISKSGIGSILNYLILALFLASCDTIEEEPMPVFIGSPTLVDFPKPSNFPNPVFIESNPLTKEGVLLGRHLFYDPSISANGNVSCASCHNPSLAFSDGLSLTNFGVSGKKLERHSPVLFNMAWMGNGFFWDGGSKNLESQAFGPLTHADEMGMDLNELQNRLIQNPDYVSMFEAAFENGASAANAAKALAQFQRTLISAGTKYDKSLRETSGASLSALELKGLQLIQKHCASCHSGILFSDNLFHNNGLDANFSDQSHEMIHLGRFRITFKKEDTGAFKTPSLRNVMVSFPYMHDGRFATIDDVLDHYSAGIKDTPYTSPLLYQKEGKAGIPVNSNDKAAIKAFLYTLTDHQFLQNQAFSNPFK